MDDTAVIVRKGDEEVLLSHLNSVHACIKFTCEKETEGRIAFLDIFNSSSGGWCAQVERLQEAYNHGSTVGLLVCSWRACEVGRSH